MIRDGTAEPVKPRLIEVNLREAGAVIGQLQDLPLAVARQERDMEIRVFVLKLEIELVRTSRPLQAQTPAAGRREVEIRRSTAFSSERGNRSAWNRFPPAMT